jgi:hypothetical protein
MEAAGSSEMLVSANQNTSRHILEDHYLDINCLENPESHTNWNALSLKTLSQDK